MERRKIIKYVDLNGLKKKYINGKECIDWINSCGKDIPFQYDNIKGSITLVSRIKESRYSILYNNQLFEIDARHLAEGKLGNIIGYFTSEYRFSIGEKVKLRTGYVEILEKYKSKYSTKYYKLKCSSCGGILNKPESHLLSKTPCGCGYCTNQRVLVGFNDINTTNKTLSDMLLNKEDGYKFTDGSLIKLDWKCPDCGYITRGKSPCHVMRTGLNCHCDDNIGSYPNRFFFNLLKCLNENFDSEKKFEWSNGKIYDFYIPDKNIIIEAHGLQHYNGGFKYYGGRNEYEEHSNDVYKEKIAIENGITNYIQIDCRYSEVSFIRDNILNSKLVKFYDFSNVDWDSINELSTANVHKRIFKMWETGNHDMFDISDKLGISYGTVNICINQFAKQGKIEYDNTERKKITMRNVCLCSWFHKCKPLVCAETNQCFQSIKCASDNSTCAFGTYIHASSVSNVVNGKKKSVKGYTFKFITYEQFNEIKRTTPEKAFGDFFILEDSSPHKKSTTNLSFMESDK